MPDWKPEIRRRLAGLQLAPPREAAIVEETAANCWRVNYAAWSGQRNPSFPESSGGAI
jgi:hypothetical protein